MGKWRKMANCVDENDGKEKSKISQVVINNNKPQNHQVWERRRKIQNNTHTVQSSSCLRRSRLHLLTRSQSLGRRWLPFFLNLLVCVFVFFVSDNISTRRVALISVFRLVSTWTERRKCRKSSNAYPISPRDVTRRLVGIKFAQKISCSDNIFLIRLFFFFGGKNKDYRSHIGCYSLGNQRLVARCRSWNFNQPDGLISNRFIY